MPPRCLPGSRSATVSPSRAAATAVITPPAVPPYTTTSKSCGGLSWLRASAGFAGAAAGFFRTGAGNGSVSGTTRTPLVILKGYLPPLGNVISTKNAVKPFGGRRTRATHVFGPLGVSGVLV